MTLTGDEEILLFDMMYVRLVGRWGMLRFLRVLSQLDFKVRFYMGVLRAVLMHCNLTRK
jgi:hypothetical protein